MQNEKEVAEELKIHKDALLLHTLSVKDKRTPEEDILYEQLLQAQLAKLYQKRQPEPEPEAAGLVEDDLYGDGYENGSENQTPDNGVQRVRKTSTVGAQISKYCKPGAVKVKQDANSEYPEDKPGSEATPVKLAGRTFSKQRFFLSPGGTTATYEVHTSVSVKKVSGGQFVEPASEEDTEKSENSSSFTS